MPARSPSVSPDATVVATVLGDLPGALLRALDAREVAPLLERLLADGWRPGQVRARVGAEPAQGGPDRDAAHLVEVLQALTAEIPPDVAHARAVRERQHRAREDGPTPASPEVRDRAIARIRAQLRGAPAPRAAPVPRTRPACSLCDGEGTYFVTREVHLCRRCVAVLATGEARLSVTG